MRKHLDLIQSRTDRLADLRQQLIFLGAPLRVVHDHVIFQRQSDLQSQADQQPQIRISEQAPLGVRKKYDAKIVFPGLQAHCGRITDVFRDHRFPELFKSSPRKSRQRLRHLRKIAERDKSAAPVGQFANVFPGAGGV